MIRERRLRTSAAGPVPVSADVGTVVSVGSGSYSCFSTDTGDLYASVEGCADVDWFVSAGRNRAGWYWMLSTSSRRQSKVTKSLFESIIPRFFQISRRPPHLAISPESLKFQAFSGPGFGASVSLNLNFS